METFLGSGRASLNVNGVIHLAFLTVVFLLCFSKVICVLLAKVKICNVQLFLRCQTSLELLPPDCFNIANAFWSTSSIKPCCIQVLY